MITCSMCNPCGTYRCVPSVNFAITADVEDVCTPPCLFQTMPQLCDALQQSTGADFNASNTLKTPFEQIYRIRAGAAAHDHRSAPFTAALGVLRRHEILQRDASMPGVPDGRRNVGIVVAPLQCAVISLEWRETAQPEAGIVLMPRRRLDIPVRDQASRLACR